MTWELERLFEEPFKRQDYESQIGGIVNFGLIVIAVALGAGVISMIAKLALISQARSNFETGVSANGIHSDEELRMAMGELSKLLD